jgi:hypothetical protein
MAEKVQLNSTLTSETRERLREAAKERGMAQADIVEAALVAWLTPSAVQEEASLPGQLQRIEDTQRQIVTLLELLVTPQGVPAAPPTPPVKIATYDEMYGPIPEPKPVVTPHAPALPRPRGRLRRWFLKEQS